MRDDVRMSEESVEVEVGPEGIRLGQLLKLASIVDSGGEAKALLEAGGVRVNGRPEARRGAQLKPGDTVHAAGVRIRVR
jgi:ribosome-associated protein